MSSLVLRRFAGGGLITFFSSATQNQLILSPEVSTLSSFLTGGSSFYG